MTDQQPAVRIRDAGPADADALGRVGAESFRAAYGDTTTAADVEAHIQKHFGAVAIRDAMATETCHYLLASVDEQPAGMLKLRRNDCPADIPESTAIEIQALYVGPAFQRSGLGGQLVAAAIETARTQGFNSVWLSAWEDADWAVSFYEKLGFRRYGTQEFLVGETPYTDLIMWRPFD